MVTGSGLLLSLVVVLSSLPLSSSSRILDRRCHPVSRSRFTRAIDGEEGRGIEKHHSATPHEVCYVVEDAPGVHTWNRYTRSLVLTSPFRPSLNVSVVYLRRPRTSGMRAVIGADTRLWRVDHAHDPFLQAIRAEFLMPIVLKAMPLYTKYEEHNVLFFGLGGGAGSMYLRFQRPKINITIVEEEQDVIELSKRWFGLLEDSRYSILHQKADAFLREAMHSGRLYDVITVDWLDSADLSISARIIVSEIPRLASASLSPSGVFVVHINDVSPSHHEFPMILSSLLSHFPSCISLRLANDHVVLTCFNKKFAADTTKPFVDRFNLVASHFHFKTTRHFVSLTLHTPGAPVETVRMG